MVKNTKGGNKSKGIARKHLSGAREQRALRFASCNLEKYGAVIRVLGNGMFYVITDEQPQLLGHIRNKFRGRSKRDNTIAIGAVVLVGLREWEYPNFKECDLLEVYDANEVRQLIKHPSIDLSDLLKHIDLNNCGAADAVGVGSSEILFEEDRDYMDGLIPDDLEGDNTLSATETHTELLVDVDDI